MREFNNYIVKVKKWMRQKYNLSKITILKKITSWACLVRSALYEIFIDLPNPGILLANDGLASNALKYYELLKQVD